MTNQPPIIGARTPEIRNRTDFFAMLASTTAEMDDLVAREPAYPVWAGLQRQLHAMRDWTANGAEPTPEQRARISIGLVAARELEPAADARMEDLITRLHLLSYYWRHWPTERAPSVQPASQIVDVRPKKSAAGTVLKKSLLKHAKITIPLLISLALFVVACCLPALEFRNSKGPNDVMCGLRALAVGWSGIFAAVFAWYANPCWLLGFLLALFQRRLLATVVGIAAIALAASTFAVVGRELPGDEGNVTRTTVVRLLPGCYLWMASMTLLPFAAFFRHPH